VKEDSSSVGESLFVLQGGQHQSAYQGVHGDNLLERLVFLCGKHFCSGLNHRSQL
jgi:hypothetical protein